MKKLIHSVVVIVAICMMIVNTVKAVEPADSCVVGSPYEVLECLGVYVSPTDDVGVDCIQAECLDNLSVQRAENSIEGSGEDFPAIKVTTDNSDGTTTTQVYGAFYIDEITGEITSAIQMQMGNDGASLLSYSPSYVGFSFVLDATYSEKSLSSLGYNGYAFAPVSSKFTISRGTATGTIGQCDFFTYLGGKDRYTTSLVFVADDFPAYEYTETTASLSMGYTYTFDDYAD